VPGAVRRQAGLHAAFRAPIPEAGRRGLQPAGGQDSPALAREGKLGQDARAHSTPSLSRSSLSLSSAGLPNGRGSSPNRVATKRSVASLILSPSSLSSAKSSGIAGNSTGGLPKAFAWRDGSSSRMAASTFISPLPTALR